MNELLESIVMRLQAVFDPQVLGEQIELLQERLETAASEDPPRALSAREMFEIRELHTNARQAQHAW